MARPLPALEPQSEALDLDAPLFVDDAGRPVALLDPRRRSRVVVLAERWGRADRAPCQEGSDDDLRAHLRGFGASLLVILESGEGSFLLGPDDRAQPLTKASAVSPHASARRALGLSSGRAQLSLVLLDGEGTVRFRSEIEHQGDALAPVLHALRAAHAEVRAPPREPLRVSRREWVLSAVGAAFALALFEACGGKSGTPSRPIVPPETAADAGVDVRGLQPVTLEVNGAPHTLQIEPRVTLLDALREQLGLTGTKKGCDHGQCGACTVLVDGRRINACLTLAIMTEGAKVTTIEGLAPGDALHPVQEAFLTHDGFQCGYCTPGQIMSAVGLIRENRAHTAEAIRVEMSGNLCRCGAYPNIVAAVQDAQKRA